MGEEKMISYFMDQFPTGILSIVSDTFDLWKLITEYLPANKEQIMSRDGKLVIRPDSGDPVDIICGKPFPLGSTLSGSQIPESKGVVELLWDIFGGTINEQGFKVLDPHIGAIYGDSINLERQIQIYERLAAKGFASTNIVLGIGSFTYQMNTRDTLGFAAKGAWFEIDEHFRTVKDENGNYTHSETIRKGYDIYKDPITDDGTKKSLKGLIQVVMEGNEYHVNTQCTWEQEGQGYLQTIFEDGKFYNQISLTTIREKINEL
jgi:nicotinamide phosphoribosyltransferase